MTILITGANGTVSTEVLKELDAQPGETVRAMVRDTKKAPDLPNVEVVVGDMEDPRSLAAPFEGVETLWLLTPFGPAAPNQHMNAIHAAKQAGVRHIVRMSAVGAGYDAPTRNGRLHALSEAELRESGMDWTIIRPMAFAQIFLGAVSGDTFYGSTADGHLAPIDTRDIGEFAAKILRNPAEHRNQVYTITGPESRSMRDVTKDLEPVLGKTLSYLTVTPEQMEQTALSFGVPTWQAEVYGEYTKAYSENWADFTTPHFEEVVGHRARTFVEFAKDHHEALVGAH